MDHGDKYEVPKQILQLQKTRAHIDYKKYCEETDFESLGNSKLYDTQENKSDSGSDQPTKSDGIPGNESTNGSDGSALFSLYVLIRILVNTRRSYIRR